MEYIPLNLFVTIFIWFGGIRIAMKINFYVKIILGQKFAAVM